MVGMIGCSLDAWHFKYLTVNRIYHRLPLSNRYWWRAMASS
jgi:hypothetical protein